MTGPERRWAASLRLQDVASGAIFENTKALVSGSCAFFVGTVHPVDVLLPLAIYRDLGQTVARLHVTSRAGAAVRRMSAPG
jgi:hypothetical protein